MTNEPNNISHQFKISYQIKEPRINTVLSTETDEYYLDQKNDIIPNRFDNYITFEIDGDLTDIQRMEIQRQNKLFADRFALQDKISNGKEHKIQIHGSDIWILESDPHYQLDDFEIEPKAINKNKNYDVYRYIRYLGAERDKYSTFLQLFRQILQSITTEKVIYLTRKNGRSEITTPDQATEFVCIACMKTKTGFCENHPL